MSAENVDAKCADITASDSETSGELGALDRSEEPDSKMLTIRDSGAVFLSRELGALVIDEALDSSGLDVLEPDVGFLNVDVAATAASMLETSCDGWDVTASGGVSCFLALCLRSSSGFSRIKGAAFGPCAPRNGSV
jgi:hypothetical protein